MGRAAAECQRSGNGENPGRLRPRCTTRRVGHTNCLPQRPARAAFEFWCGRHPRAPLAQTPRPLSDDLIIRTLDRRVLNSSSKFDVNGCADLTVVLEFPAEVTRADLFPFQGRVT